MAENLTENEAKKKTHCRIENMSSLASGTVGSNDWHNVVGGCLPLSSTVSFVLPPFLSRLSLNGGKMAFIMFMCTFYPSNNFGRKGSAS